MTPSHESPFAFFARLAVRFAPAWIELGTQTFAGDLSFRTKNSTYHFRNGVFMRRSKDAIGSEAPSSLRGVRLIGFLSASGFSPRWCAGARAVLWNGEMNADAFVFTSPTSDLTQVEPVRSERRPTPSPWQAHVQPAGDPMLQSGVVLRQVASPPPTYRRPLPPSMTRLHVNGSGR